MGDETVNAPRQNFSIEDDDRTDGRRSQADDDADADADPPLADLLLHEGGVEDAQHPDDGVRAKVDAGGRRLDLVERAD